MPRSYSPPDCDVVVLSGDICSGLPGVMWAIETFTVPVIYINGNHEFYVKRPWREQLARIKAKAEGTNVHVLNNESVVVDGVRFIGATLWADFDLYGLQFFHQMQAQKGMNDYNFIWSTEHTRFTAEDSLAEHKVSRFYINEELSKPFEGKSVVCTHHAPSGVSVVEKWKSHPLTPAYASRLENIMLDHNPVLWTHGHMHDSVDYVIGDTRVVANPRGYHGQEVNPLYNDQLVIEI
jgi:Icc-related predicted phosphoesterase